MYETLVYKKEAGLGIITLNQPNVLNALNAKAYEELYEVAELADQGWYTGPDLPRRWAGLLCR